MREKGEWVCVLCEGRKGGRRLLIQTKLVSTSLTAIDIDILLISLMAEKLFKIVLEL